MTASAAQLSHRKFALIQAVKAHPEVRVVDSDGHIRLARDIVDMADVFENYLLNGKSNGR